MPDDHDAKDAPAPAELEARAQSERRLGLLILENKNGAALAAGVPHFRNAAELWAQAGWPSRRRSAYTA